MKLDRFQAQILEFLFEGLPITKHVDYIDARLSGNSSERLLVAFAEITYPDAMGEMTYVVFNIPRHSSTVFLGLTKTEIQMSALVLSNLEDYERTESLSLGLGEVIITPNTNESENYKAPYGVILLPTAVSLDCANIPNRISINGRETNFLLAVPITSEENQLRHRLGHDALMDRFEANDKDLLFR